MPREMLTRLGFTAGIKPSFNPATIAPDALADGRNVDADDIGVLHSRPGASEVGTSLGNGSFQSLVAAFSTLVGVWNRSLYRYDFGTSTWVPILQNSIGTSATAPVSVIPWTYGGEEVVYVLSGSGLFRSNQTTCSLVTPYAPAVGEPYNILRAADGTQDTESEVYKSTIGLIRPGLASRMAVAYGNRVYLSAPGDPSYWPDDQMISLPDDGDQITALELWYGALIIFRRKDIWAFFGTSATDADAQLVRQAKGVGCSAPRSVVHVPQVGLVFLGPDNIYALTRVTGVENQVEPTSIGDDVVVHLKRAMADGVANATAIFYDRQYFLSFPDAIEPERVFRLRTFPTLGWYVDTGPQTKFYVELDGSLYMAAASSGLVWKRGGRTDPGNAGIPFSTAFKHEMLSHGPARIRRVFVFLDTTDTLQHITTTVIVDGLNMQTVEMELVGEASENFTIGQSVIGGPAILGRFSRIIVYEGRVNLKGQFIQIRIHGSAPSEKIGILGYAVEYRPRRGKGRRDTVTVE